MLKFLQAAAANDDAKTIAIHQIIYKNSQANKMVFVNPQLLDGFFSITHPVTRALLSYLYQL